MKFKVNCGNIFSLKGQIRGKIYQHKSVIQIPCMAGLPCGKP